MMPRSPSGTLRSKATIENVTSALCQKDKMVDLLKKELEGYRSLHQDYDRLRDRKTLLLDKCDTINREITIHRESHTRKAASDMDMLQDLSSNVLSLQKQLQNKNYHLKTLKCQTQTLLASNEQRDQDLTQYLDAIEVLKANGQGLRLERDRLRQQLNSADEEISKIRHKCNQSIGSNDKVRNQISSTQSFFRHLESEESKVGNKLSTLQDENNALDGIIDDMNNVLELTKLKTKDVKQNKENIEFKMQAKKIDKGRMEAEYAEKHKQFKVEREKEKKLKEQIDARKGELQRISMMDREVTEEIEQIISRNLQIQDINMQLKGDLDVCKRHLENVSRINANVLEDLQGYKQTNIVVIKKLKQPVDEGWAALNGTTTYRKNELAESTSDNFNFART